LHGPEPINFPVQLFLEAPTAAKIADVDVNLLTELHQYGRVKNLKNRRKDLYKLQKIGAKQRPIA
jgi:hypothetical protein